MAPRHPEGGLFITCQRLSCGQVKAVKNRHVQAVQRFCSNRCWALERHARRKTGPRFRCGRCPASRPELFRPSDRSYCRACRRAYARERHAEMRDVNWMASQELPR
jgi:hypothetical protein